MHSALGIRQNQIRYRSIIAPVDEVFHSNIQYHFAALPRGVSTAVLGLDTSVSHSSTIRCVPIRVMNSRVESVGLVLVDVDTSQKTTGKREHLDTVREKCGTIFVYLSHIFRVYKLFSFTSFHSSRRFIHYVVLSHCLSILLVSEVMEAALKLVTPTMQKRGSNPQLPHRLVWVGAPRPVHQFLPTHQLAVCPNRLEILDDQLLQLRLPLLDKGFQYDTPLRIEPDFTAEEFEALRMAEKFPYLPEPSSPMPEKPRPLVKKIISMYCCCW